MCVGPHAIIRHVFVYVCVHVFVICIPVCHNGAALQILASSSGPPYPLFLPLSLFQVQRRFSNAITLTIWWEHQLNCCCFSAAWPAYRSNTHTAVRPRTFTHTHTCTCMYSGWPVYRSKQSHMALLFLHLLYVTLVQLKDNRNQQHLSLQAVAHRKRDVIK